MSSENGMIPLDYDSENGMDCLTLEWLYLFFCSNSLCKHQTWGFCEVFFCSGFRLGKSCATKFHNTMHVYSNSVPNGMKASKEMRELTEMPTSGDLKSGDYLFFTTPPPGFQRRPPHPPTRTNWPSPNGNGSRHYNEVLHEVHTIKLCDHRFDAKIIIVSD